jgi:tricorn protease
VPDGRYQQIAAMKGKVLYTSLPIEGSLNMNWFQLTEPPAKATLEVYDFENLKAETLLSGITNFKLSEDRKTLAYRAGNKLRVLKAGEKPDEKSAAEPPGKKSGWIDLTRIRVSVDPPAEWRQMFREAWRLQRDHFWTEDMADVDWHAVYERYFPLIDRISTRAEFSDLMWEMQGELGTSHAYEFGGDYRPEPRYDMGFLGADLAYDKKLRLWKVAHIVRGDPWDPTKSSPLAQPGVNVREGDTILAINGRRVDENTSPYELLVNHANCEVLLTVGDAKGENPRTVSVKALASETPARYREWVEQNRKFVHEKTDGRVGYVHIPNMGPLGYSEFHRYFLSEIDREGLIVDVRFNGGGHVSELILEKLARRRIAYVKTRWFGAQPYPSDSVAGPMVALTNEYAGSDGDIFSHNFKLLKLGPLVGKRTWGGVIGIWARHSLVDGGITTQPEFSFWFQDVGWKVENYGTDPDIEVEYRPQDYVVGKDPQLERAVHEIVKLLETNPPSRPEFTPRPSRSLPKLPKR